MNIKEWIDTYVDDDEKPEDAIKQVLSNSLYRAMEYHLSNDNLEGAKVYKDLKELLNNDKIEVRISE